VTGVVTGAERPHPALLLQVTDALNRRRNKRGERLRHPASAYVTSLLVPEGGEVLVDYQALRVLGVAHVVRVASCEDEGGRRQFDPEALVQAIADLMPPLPLSTAASAVAHQCSTGVSVGL
jgi:hypothetical protein